MNGSNSEQLLGYLLGALDEAERLEIERRLETDPALRAQLWEAETQLAPLAYDDQPELPPVGLAQRTCDWIFEAGIPSRDSQTGSQEKVSLPPVRETAANSRSFGLADVVVACGVFFAAALLFFPAIANSRFQSQLVACQNNLRELGLALEKFSQLHRGFYPEVPAQGKLAGAGIYGPVLWENQLIDDPALLLCPSTAQCRQGQEFAIPSTEKLLRADGVELAQLKRNMGGSYGYSLGYLDDGKYRAPRNLHRSQFPIMSDAPSLHLVGRKSNNHGGRGQNVLYENGAVRYLVDTEFGGDSLFLSNRGFVEAGQNPADAVIGSSDSQPLSLRPGY